MNKNNHCGLTFTYNDAGSGGEWIYYDEKGIVTSSSCVCSQGAADFAFDGYIDLTMNSPGNKGTLNNSASEVDFGKEDIGPDMIDDESDGGFF